MSDTVYETNHEGNRLTFGRFWREGKDWIIESGSIVVASE